MADDVLLASYISPLGLLKGEGIPRIATVLGFGDRERRPSEAEASIFA